MRIPPIVSLLILLSALAGCSTPSEFSFGKYSEAEQLYEKGKYEKAIRKYEEYIRENREGNMTVIAYYSVAKSYEALNRLEEARSVYRKIRDEYRRTVWAGFAKARLQELSLAASSTAN